MVKVHNEEDDVTYISYINDDEKLDLWRVSTVTKIAQQIDRAEQSPEYPQSMLERSVKHDIRYITEHLKELGFCEFQRDGQFIHFKEYYTEGDDIFMHTKNCKECGVECLLNTDQEKCLKCRESR